MINDIEIPTPHTLKFELEKQVYRAIKAAGLGSNSSGGSSPSGDTCPYPERLTEDKVLAMIKEYCGDTSDLDILDIYNNAYLSDIDIGDLSGLDIISIYDDAYGALP